MARRSAAAIEFDLEGEIGGYVTDRNGNVIDLKGGVSTSSDAELIARAMLREARNARSNLSLFYSFVMRHEITKQRLITAPHQKLAFSFIEAHPLCVLRIPVGMGKCVTGNTKIACQKTGQLRRIVDIVADYKATRISSWTQNGGIEWSTIGGKYATGIKECLRIKLRTGRFIETTPEHPYLTPEGWRSASELRVGDTVAIAALLPVPEIESDLTDAEVLLLAVLFAEGSTTQAARFSTDDPILLDLVKEAAARLGCEVVFYSDYDYSIVRTDKSSKCNPVTYLIRSERLFGCKSKNKRIPPSVFGLSAKRLAQFLSVIWMCDGTVSNQDVSITLASEIAIDEIQHLLLRLGIQSSKRYKKATCEKKQFDSWRLSILAPSLDAFAAQMTLWGDKALLLSDLLSKTRNFNVGFPVVSESFQTEFADIVEKAGVSIGKLKSVIGWISHATLKELVFGKTMRGNGRRAIASPFWNVCKQLGITQHDWMRSSDLYWDEIVSIEPIGKRDVYDLTVDDSHCFVANDIIAHNTYMMAATALWLLGNDVTQRAAIVSKTQGQAEKPLGMISDYITEPYLAAGLALVFPWLKRSPRLQDPWTKTEITVERPAGIRDPSLASAGLDMAAAGSRWSFLVADDLVDDENSMTPAARDKVRSRFNGRHLSRLDPAGARAIVTNTPWDRNDLTYYLENDAQWPTLTMDIYGFVRFSNASASWLAAAKRDHMRPSTTRTDEKHDWYRLLACDPDPTESTVLWPERYSIARINEIRYGSEGRGGMLPHEFARLFLCEPLDPTATRCQRAWIERCKQRGIGKQLLDHYDGPLPTYTGVDLGVGPGKKHDPTVFFTFSRHKDGSREILNIESGRFTGPEIIDKLVGKSQRYGSVTRVETNAAQDFIRQFALEKQRDLRVQAHATSASNKYDKDFGVESIFTEFQNGAWIIPCDSNGRCDPEVQNFVDECMYYQPPPAHTGNALMAAWLGREASRRGSRGNVHPKPGKRRALIYEGGY